MLLSCGIYFLLIYLFIHASFGSLDSIIIATSGLPRNFVGGVQKIQLRTKDRENGHLGAVAP